MKSPLEGVSHIADSAQTSGCTSWYWCQPNNGCEYLYSDCNFDEGTPPNDNPGDPTGGGGDRRNIPGCAECKRFADREHDRNLTLAKTALTGAVLGGCHYAGAQTFIAFNAAGWWANLIPGIGTGAIEALSALGGSTVDISCLVTSVLTYNATEATIENNHYKDIRDCREKYTDCDN